MTRKDPMTSDDPEPLGSAPSPTGQFTPPPRFEQMDSSRPWESRVAALEEEHGPYAGYHAWEAWMYDVADKHLVPVMADPILDALDTFQRINLYATMCQLADKEAR